MTIVTTPRSYRSRATKKSKLRWALSNVSWVMSTSTRNAVLSEFHHYYVKGRVFEWTFALAMFVGGLQCLVWDNVISFGAFRWMLEVMSQKWIGSLMFFIGWIRISALMFNGQLLFGRRMGLMARAICAVISASIWAQFAMSLVQGAILSGTPSIGLPFWTMFMLAELLIAYQVGAQWKR